MPKPTWTLSERSAPSAVGLPSARRQTRCCERLRFLPRGNHRAVNRSKDRAGVIEKHAPRRKQSHTSRRALEELRADFVFKRTDMPTNRGLRDVEALWNSAERGSRLVFQP